MKKILKEFIPPIVLRALKGNHIKHSILNSHQIFLSYQDAMKGCITDAYEDEELAEVILKTTKRFKESLKSEIIPIWATMAYSFVSIINPIIENKSQSINVLDFGGSFGGHYYFIRNLIDKSLKLNWVVVETPLTVRLAKELETDELFFFDNFEDAIKKLVHIDLVHASGTIKCVDNPEKYLTYIFNCNSKWLLFSRLGLNKLDRDVVTIHSSKLSWNVYGELPEGYIDRWVKYPFCFLSENNFIKKVEDKYSLVAKFDDQSGMYKVDNEEIVGYGLLCKQKAKV